MQSNNKLQNIWMLLEEYFFIPFFGITALVFLCFYITPLHLFYFSKTSAIYFTMVSAFLIFFFWFKKLNKESKINTFLKELLQNLFITILPISSLYYVNSSINLGISEGLNNIGHYIVLFNIFFGFMYIFINREEIEQRIDAERNTEINAEKQRVLDSITKYPRKNKIPIFNNIFRWFYKEKLINIVFLIFVFLIFIGIKIPNIQTEFTGNHSMKYSNIVEPAKHMLENNLLWNQYLYQADPIILPDGKFDTFGQYPIIEWSIVIIKSLFSSLSIEASTRIVMIILGLMLLFLIYSFLKKFLLKKQVLFILFLLSINQIFQFFTFVTVLDPVNLIFLFGSLILLVDGLTQDNVRKIFLSGIFAGIGINIKYHALIFYFPIFIIFFFLFKKIQENKRISYLLITLPNFLLQTILFRISFRYIPKNPLLYLSIFVMLIIIQFFIYKNITKINEKVENFLQGKERKFYIIIFSTIFILLIAIFNIDWIQMLLKNFTTDKYLIFNWQMYETLLNRYKEWANPIIFYSFIPILILNIFFIRNKENKILIFSFLASSFIYFVLTTKVLYFHEYYHHIMIIMFIFVFSFTYQIFKINKIKLQRIILLLSCITLIFSMTYDNIIEINTKFSAKRSGTEEVSTYINKYLKEDEYFIHSLDIPTTLSLYSNRLSLFETLSSGYNVELVKKIKEDLRNNMAFGKVMRKYKIKLYITRTMITDKRNDFTYLFNNEKDNKEQINLAERTILILCKENNLCTEDNRFLSIRDSKVFKEKVINHLNLVKQEGEYYVYEFI